MTRHKKKKRDLSYRVQPSFVESDCYALYIYDSFSSFFFLSLFFCLFLTLILSLSLSPFLSLFLSLSFLLCLFSLEWAVLWTVTESTSVIPKNVSYKYMLVLISTYFNNRLQNQVFNKVVYYIILHMISLRCAISFFPYFVVFSSFFSY